MHAKYSSWRNGSPAACERTLRPQMQPFTICFEEYRKTPVQPKLSYPDHQLDSCGREPLMPVGERLHLFDLNQM